MDKRARKPPPPDVALTPESFCLQCEAPLDAVGTGDRAVAAKPSPGDLTVCVTCGAVMMLDDDLRVRGMTDDEMDALTADHETMDSLARMVRTVHLFRASSGRAN